jgi:hypothetical protein
VTVFHKPKTQNSDRLETNWKKKIVTVFNKLTIQQVTILFFQFVSRRSLFCVFGLWKTVTILYFQFVKDGYYVVFSVCGRRSLCCIFSLLKTVTILFFQVVSRRSLFCVFGLLKTVTILYFQFVEDGHDRLQQTENTI